MLMNLIKHERDRTVFEFPIDNISKIERILLVLCH